MASLSYDVWVGSVGDGVTWAANHPAAAYTTAMLPRSTWDPETRDPNTNGYALCEETPICKSPSLL